jgi:phosphoglycerate dehydrogenase-like enzyme
MTQEPRKKVFVGSEFMHPDGEPIMAAEVDIVYGLPEEERKRFRVAEGRAERRAMMFAALDEALPEIHGIYAQGVGGFLPVTADVFERGPKLEVVIVPGSGFENVDVDAATAFGVPVVNAAGAAYIPVAEHVIGLMLSLVKWIAIADRRSHADKQAPALMDLARGVIPTVLWGKTLGIVGLGYIGRSLAQKALHGFEMDVVAFDPYYDPVEAERQGVRMFSDLDEMLPQCDVVSVNCPLTAETTSLIDERRLGLFKPTAILVNASRGGTVDTEALLRALQDHRIAGAGLDVTDPEPLPPGHPLFDLDNVVLTPHIGGVAREFIPRMAVQTVRYGLAVLRGERPHHLVNPDVWPRFVARMEATAPAG